MWAHKMHVFVSVHGMYKQTIHNTYCIFVCVCHVTPVLNIMYIISNNNVEKMTAKSSQQTVLNRHLGKVGGEKLREKNGLRADLLYMRKRDKF